MVFESEADLREVARPAIRDKLGTEKTQVVPEFSYSAGRTDLVYTCVSDKYLQRRVKDIGIGVPITEKSHLKAFLQLRERGEITEEYFYEIGASSRSTKKKALSWLIDNNFVDQTEDNKLRTAPYLRKHITQSYAVELKLSKWNQALKQAIRGRSFSEFQYVALDVDHIDGALNNRSKFKEAGVGMLSIDEKGNCVEHVQPEKVTPFSPLNKWSLNETTLIADSSITQV